MKASYRNELRFQIGQRVLDPAIHIDIVDEDGCHGRRLIAVFGEPDGYSNVYVARAHPDIKDTEMSAKTLAILFIADYEDIVGDQ